MKMQKVVSWVSYDVVAFFFIMNPKKNVLVETQTFLFKKYVVKVPMYTSRGKYRCKQRMPVINVHICCRNNQSIKTIKHIVATPNPTWYAMQNQIQWFPKNYFTDFHNSGIILLFE